MSQLNKEEKIEDNKETKEIKQKNKMKTRTKQTREVEL